MSGAMKWSGTPFADQFIFDNDSGRFDFVIGGAGDDYISDGNSGPYWSDDVFLGQRGNDTLISTGGNDLLRGGKGDDHIEVHLGWYDPADLQFPIPGVESGQVGFHVEVHGGKGWDTLTIHNSEGYRLEDNGDSVIIHSIWGGTVTVHDVEEFIFL